MEPSDDLSTYDQHNKSNLSEAYSDDLSTYYDQHNKSNLSEAYEDYYSNAIDTKLFEKYYKNRSVSDTAFWTLVVSYSVLITVGTLGNLFVMSAVIRNNSKYFFVF